MLSKKYVKNKKPILLLIKKNNYGQESIRAIIANLFRL